MIRSNDNRVRSVAVNLPQKNKLGLIGMMVWVTPICKYLKTMSHAAG